MYYNEDGSIFLMPNQLAEIFTTPDWFMVGQFEVTNSEIKVTDPCYRDDTWCSGKFPAKNGTWVAAVQRDETGGWGVRNNRLFIIHSESFGQKKFFQRLDADIGVDSGQCGFWDAEYYRANQGGKYGDQDSFYGKACSATLDYITEKTTRLGAGIVGQGVNSMSGFGDGSYGCRVAYIDGVAVCAEVIFINEEDNEEDEP